jgi:hypothetical protein
MFSSFDRGIATAGLKALALLVAVAATACDKMPLTAPTSSTISVVAGASTLPVGGATQIIATVIEGGGQPVQNGTVVRFTTTLGSLSAPEVQTQNGQATVTFNAGAVSGTAEIRATSGSATGSSSGGTTTGTTTGTTSSGNIGAAVSIAIGAANVNTVILTASPGNVPSTGGNVTMIATALDTNGNRLVGVPVTFSTTAGTLSSSVATTDGNGEARVQLTTNRTATVTAAAGSKTSNAVTVTASGSNSISIAVAPATVTVGAPVTLTVTPVLGTNANPPRVNVDWGDGSTSDLGVVGSARTVAHTYTKAGVFTIVATATSEGGDITTASTAVTVNPQATIAVAITTSAAAPHVNDQVTFTATVSGDTNANVQSYTFTVSGSGSENATITQSSGVLVRVFSTAGLKTVSVTATTTDGRTASNSTQVNVLP